MVSTEKISFRQELKQWRTLLRRREALARAIDKQREVRIELHLSIKPAGIRSAIIQRYDNMLLGLPRGSDVSDKTGNTVADTEERLERADERMEATLRDYLDVCDQITRIEAEVDMLRDDREKPYRSVVTAFYAKRAPWYDIVRDYNVTKTTLYRWLEEAIEVIDESLWRR